MVYSAWYKIREGDTVLESGFHSAVDVRVQDGVLLAQFKDRSLLVLPVQNIIGEISVEVSHEHREV